MKAGTFGAALYALVALGTFGYAADERDRSTWARYAACTAQTGDRAYICDAPMSVDAPVVGLIGGALWPLYWTWVAVAEARS